MELTLYLPGLLLPRAVLADSLFDLSAPALEWMLGRSKRRELPADWLATRFGFQEPLPAAALRKVGAGETGEGTSLCLDPVHWQVTREGIRLGHPAQLVLHEDEAMALREAIAPMFADWGTLQATAPHRWELQLTRPLALTTQALPDAIGQPIDPALPGGEDGRTWRRLMAEAQTLLHSHPVNRSRAALARPLINSLWPWGAGSLPSPQQTGFNVLWTDDPVSVGLAAHAGLPCLQPSPRFESASGHVLAILTPLLSAARERDVMAWRSHLLALEHDWIAPALTALRQRDLTCLHLVGTALPSVSAAVGFLAHPGDHWRFWCRARPLTDLA
jgi:hypothetical protein